MKHDYPSAGIVWASQTASLTPEEVTYGIRMGWIDDMGSSGLNRVSSDSSVEPSDLNEVREVMFRILVIYLYRSWFTLQAPLTALESLALDFRDTDSVNVADGMLLSGVAGISEVGIYTELEPEYFFRKVKTFNWLSKYVLEVVRSGIKSKPSMGLLNK